MRSILLAILALSACTPLLWSEGSAQSASHRTLEVGGATLHIEAARGPLPRETIEGWVRRSAEIVTEYYGGSFPVPELRVEAPNRGRRVGWGFHRAGRLVRVGVGDSANRRDLERDWVLIHEMLHTGFPSLDRRHRWMREGLSTYLETTLRGRAGILTDDEVWDRWLDKMPAGLHGSSLGPLDRRRGWGATYWGGALWWLLVDVELRNRTDNDKSIRDIVRGAIARGGDARRTWPMARVIAVVDAATDTTVFSETYARFASGDGQLEAGELWRRLGVRREPDGSIAYDDAAPLAHVRRELHRARAVRLTPLP